MSNTKTRWDAHLFLFLANLIYGVSFTIAKDIIPHYIQPYGAIFIRATGALILFALSWLIFLREKIQRRDLMLLIACGFFGVAANQLLFFKGLSMTTPINAALIMVTTPILVVVIAGLTGKDKITLPKVIGIALGVAGAVTIVASGKELSFGSDHLLGDMCVFLNAASYAVFLVIVKPLMQRYNPLTVITFVFFFGWLFVIPVGWNEFLAADYASFPNHIWWELSFIVICTTFLAYLFNILALRHASSAVAGAYIYSQPVLAVLFAFAMKSLGWNVEARYGWMHFLATIMIFTGVYLVSFAGTRKQPAHEAEIDNTINE